MNPVGRGGVGLRNGRCYCANEEERINDELLLDGLEADLRSLFQLKSNQDSSPYVE